MKQSGFPLLAGGPHATLCPLEVVEHGFDAAVLGEGESAICEAIQALLGRYPKEEVPGWAYRDEKGEIRLTPDRPLIEDLDSIPLPARHLVKPEWYGGSEGGILHSGLFSSRGCPAQCTFCSGHLFGKRFRFRSAKDMLDEIEILHGKYGTSVFHFMDDAMTLHKKRLREFCAGIQERGLSIQWTVMTRVDAVNEEFLEMVASAGCTQINYGVESGNPETLKRINKPHTVEMVKKVIPMTARKRIRPGVFFILGFPWEDEQALENTIHLMQEIAPYVETFHPAVASILIPFPGTRIYEVYHEQYEFADWWLTAKKNYDTLVPHNTSYFEARIFRLGHILNADFFHYEENLKKKIIGIFEFMHFHNLSSKHNLKSRIQKGLLIGSKFLHRFSPLAERILFGPVRMAEAMVSKYR